MQVEKKDLVIDDYLMPEELVDSMLAINEFDENVRAIDEHTFRTRFLELLTNTESPQPTIGWLQIARSPYNPVNVVKDGKLLFTVPPLVRTHPTNINVDSFTNCNVIAVEYKQYLRQHPNVGMNYISQAMAGKLQLSGPDYDYVASWNKVLEYYGKPLIPLPTSFKEKEAVDDTNQPETVFDDDEFEEC